ncbi:MAG: SulP family inorganic anion transporter, partial [Vicinamibacterales bacterium]
FTVTVTGILLTDLLVGIGLGLAVAIYFILLANYRNPYFVESRPHKPGSLIRVQLSEDVSFLNRASIVRTLDAIPDGTRVEIDGTRTTWLDQDVEEIIRDFEAQATRRAIDLKIVGLEAVQANDSVRRVHRILRRERKRAGTPPPLENRHSVA